tara:strand:+ start:66 stop:530 length:465 start_codon:yes stop_codon:yes gene_type:complete
MPKTVSIDKIKNLFPSYFSADYVGQLNETKIKQILNIYSKKEGGRTFIAKKLKLDQSVVGRILLKAEKNNLIQRVQRKEFKTTESQKIYENIEERYIYLKVRQISSFDRKLNTKIPKNAKFKIQTPTGKHAPSTTVKYFNTEQEAKIEMRKWKK